VRRAGREPRRGSLGQAWRVASAFVMTLLTSLVGHAAAHPSLSFAGSSPLSGSSPSRCDCGTAVRTAEMRGLAP